MLGIGAFSTAQYVGYSGLFLRLVLSPSLGVYATLVLALVRPNECDKKKLFSTIALSLSGSTVTYPSTYRLTRLESTCCFMGLGLSCYARSNRSKELL
jgi:hypothetical protein